MCWRWPTRSSRSRRCRRHWRHAASRSRGGRRSPRPSPPCTNRRSFVSATSLVEQLKHGLDAPICLTWELTYACNLQCVHCLSSSGRRDPRELSTAEAIAVIDELRAMQVFYVNLGGGEPMLRRDFYDIVGYAVDHGVGVKFSTNGTYLD